MPETDQPSVTPAATVVIFRNAADGGPPELLMTIRSKTMSFAGGMAVFPGGKVDPADYELAGKIAPQFDAEEGAARIAVIRETLEETGLAIGLSDQVSANEASDARSMLLECNEFGPVLEKFGWQLDFEKLTYFARWLPKGMSHRIFDTRFYLSDLGTGAVDIAVDNTENTLLFWCSAKDALAKAADGEISVIFPTRRNLERLALFSSFEEAKAQADSIAPNIITPKPVEREGEMWLTIPDDIGYPVDGEPFSSAARG